MQDPQRELPDVVKALTTAPSPDKQLEAIRTYFSDDAGMNHPLCRVKSSRGSRDDSILGIYQWYRIMSPELPLEVVQHVWNKETNTAFVEVVQTFHIFLSPLKPHQTRLVVKVQLRRDPDGLYRIMQQDDFYQPEDVAYLVVPPLAKLILAAKHAGTLASNVNAWAFQTLLGWWRPRAGKGE